jgi:site-specific recombinase XerD
MARKQLTLFPNMPKDPSEITKQTALGATLDLFAEHLHKEGKSEHTVKAFMGDITLFGDKTGLDTPIGTYTTTNLNDFLVWMELERGVPCSRKTYARRVTTLKVYFKWLELINAITHDPAKAILQRSGPAPLSNVLTPDEVQECIIVSRRMKKGDDIDFRPELIFRMLVETGIKKGETANLKLTDIDRVNPQHPNLRIQHEVQNVYKERVIEFSADLLRIMDLYIMQYTPREELFTCTTRNLEYIITEIGELAEIPFKLSFENLRWTMAVRDYRAGAEEEFIREKLGLSKPSWYETNMKIKQLADQQIKDNQ